MNRSQRRRIAREMGIHRSPSKKGSRPAFRQPEQATAPEPETRVAEFVNRRPSGLHVVRYQ